MTRSKKLLNMSPTLRNSFFWISDWLKGAKIRKHHAAVTKINNNHGSDYSLKKRKQYLNDLLRHAQETVPYYRNLGIADTQLENYPVVNKNLIRSSSVSFESDKYTDKKTFKASTSGSTGTPFTVIHNLNKKKRHTADVRFFWEAVGHAFGTRFFYLRIWTNQNKKSKLVLKKNNIVPVDIFKMDDERVQAFLDDIGSSGSPKSILGYSSAFDRIVKYLQQNPSDMTHAKVVSIIAMSESLDHPTKEALGNYFDCPVVSRYANTECGMLAQQTADLKNDFLINWASYHIEVMHLEKDVPAKKGEPGRIVVTDFFNKAMPLIRYDTGDIGILGESEKDGRTQYVFKSVEGRKMDTIYDTQGEPTSSFIINNNMWKYTELAQYQFIQLAEKKYMFKLNANEKFLKENELVSEFKGYLGQDAQITVEYVNEIPLLSSGKRKKVLNEMK